MSLPRRSSTSRKSTDAFKSGKGVGWNEHSECLFCGTERFFRTGYMHHLVQRMAARARRRRGQARSAAPRSPMSAAATAPRPSSMAQAFPSSRFFGFDYHEASIEAARKAAAEAGVARPGRPSRSRGARPIRPRATISSASSIACTTWATRSARPRHVRETHGHGRHLHARRAVAGDRLEDNLNPVGRVYYAARP